MAKNVPTPATTSPEDSMPAEIRPRLPVRMPVTSLRSTSAVAAAIDMSAVRDWALPSSCAGMKVASEDIASFAAPRIPEHVFSYAGFVAHGFTHRSPDDIDPHFAAV